MKTIKIVKKGKLFLIVSGIKCARNLKDRINDPAAMNTPSGEDNSQQSTFNSWRALLYYYYNCFEYVSNIKTLWWSGYNG